MGQGVKCIIGLTEGSGSAAEVPADSRVIDDGDRGGSCSSRLENMLDVDNFRAFGLAPRTKWSAGTPMAVAGTVFSHSSVDTGTDFLAMMTTELFDVIAVAPACMESTNSSSFVI